MINKISYFKSNTDFIQVFTTIQEKYKRSLKQKCVTTPFNQKTKSTCSDLNKPYKTPEYNKNFAKSHHSSLPKRE